jgi:hypothetical protein
VRTLRKAIEFLVAALVRVAERWAAPGAGPKVMVG